MMCEIPLPQSAGEYPSVVAPLSTLWARAMQLYGTARAHRVPCGASAMQLYGGPVPWYCMVRHGCEEINGAVTVETEAQIRGRQR